MFPSVVTLVILALSGFAVGIRPRTQVPPVRSSAWLISFSVIVPLATLALVSKGCIPLLKPWGIDDFDLIALHLALGLTSVAGSVLLLTTWVYVIGRAVGRARVHPARKLQSSNVLDGWQNRERP